MSGSSRDDGRLVQRSLYWTAVILAVLAMGGSTACAADIQTRDFVVTVSGKPSGEVHMTIHKQDNGTIWMRCDTDINVPTVVGKYKFIYRGLEVWKDQRLVRFDSNTDDNGKRYIVSAVAEAGGVRIKVNNVERSALIPSGVWLSSYWCLPDQKLRQRHPAHHRRRQRQEPHRQTGLRRQRETGDRRPGGSAQPLQAQGREARHRSLVRRQRASGPPVVGRAGTQNHCRTDSRAALKLTAGDKATR